MTWLRLLDALRVALAGVLLAASFVGLLWALELAAPRSSVPHAFPSTERS